MPDPERSSPSPPRVPDQPSSPPPYMPLPPCLPDQPECSPLPLRPLVHSILPDAQRVPAYTDRRGVPLCSRVLLDNVPRYQILRPDDVSDSECPEEDQQEPNTGQHQAQYNEEDQQMATHIPGTSQAQYAKEDQPAPVHKLETDQRPDDVSDSERLEEDQQEPTPNTGQHQAQYNEEDQETATHIPGTSQAQYTEEDQPAPVHKLETDQRCEVPDLLALKLDSAVLSSSCVFPLVPTGLFIKYFVRLDKAGLFHSYPDRGGPFQNLDEAQNAIDSYHAAQRQIFCSDGLSDEEMTVRNALYWFHDGTRKNSQEALDSSASHRPTQELLNSLLDMHNEDNDLLGDDAYVLKKIVSYNSCYNGKGCIYRSYSHFNLTMETKAADDNNDLYFAEVTTTRGDFEIYVLTCLRVLKTGDNGQCHVCEDDIKHPTDDVYIHGRRSRLRRTRRSDAFGVQLFEELYAVHDEAWLKAEEASVRQLVKEEKEARLRRLVKTPLPSQPPPPSPERHSSPRLLAAVMTPPPPQGRRPSPERLDAPTSQLSPAPPVVPWHQVPGTIPPPPQGRLPSQQRRLDAPSTQRSTPDYHARAPRFMTWGSSSGYVPPPRRDRWPTPPGGRASMDKKRW